jgi:acyl-CoA synthetase (AMP-forming)/AMP-acid ligase II
LSSIRASVIEPPSGDLGKRLVHWSIHRPDEIAFLFLERGEIISARLTYLALHQRATAIAAVLRRHSLAGCPVLLVYPPGIDFIEAFFACLYSGAIAVPAPHPVSLRAAARAATLCQAAGARAVLTVASLLGDAEFKGVLDRTARDLSWIATDPIKMQDEARDGPVESSPNAAAFLQFTSGSTGTPKGVVVTRGNLAANQAMIAAAFGHDHTLRGVSWLPLFHDMGLVGTVLQALYLGALSVIMSPFAFLQKPVRWLQAITRFGATTSGAPNFAYELCCRQIHPEQCEGLDLATWQVAFCGAEPVRGATLRRFAATFGPYGFRDTAIFPCYGLAEATLFASGGPAGRGLKSLDVERYDSGASGRIALWDGPAERKVTLACCGRAWGDERVVIVDPLRGTPLGECEVGEIWLAGPHVCPGYWQRPAESTATFGARLAGDETTRYLRTGDLGFLREGELFVTGRLKDLIIVRGAKHHPEEIEATIARSHPALAGGTGAVFTLEHGEETKIIALHEIDREAMTTSDQGMLARVAVAAVNATHGFRLDALILVRSGRLPRTTSGKVQRHLCRAAYLDGRFATTTNGSAN